MKKKVYINKAKLILYIMPPLTMLLFLDSFIPRAICVIGVGLSFYNSIENNDK